MNKSEPDNSLNVPCSMRPRASIAMSEPSSTEEVDKRLLNTYALSSARLAELREIFRVFDRDNSGEISHDELETIVCVVSPGRTAAQIKLLMNKADVNGDGRLEFEEFVQLMCQTNDQEKVTENSVIKETFRIFDKDDDGYITANELREVLSKMGESFSDIQINEMLSEADKDGDGKVTFEEFEEMLKPKPEDNNEEQNQLT